MKTALRLVVGALALAVLSTGMASRSDASATTPVVTASTTGAIGGNGATFPTDQYTKWIADAKTANPTIFTSSSATGVVITYGGGGSTTGKTNFAAAGARSAASMFNGTDALLTSAERTAINSRIGGTNEAPNFIQIPMTAAPIAVITNLPGISTNIKLTGRVICRIYAGQITTWNHADILALNPTIKALKTMSATIKPVARNSGSGTTFIFATFLATAPGSETDKCGYSSDNALQTATSLSGLSGTLSLSDGVMGTRFNKMRATNIIEGSGNAGIQTAVKNNDYSIGYVEMSFSYLTDSSRSGTTNANVKQVAVQNFNNRTKFLLPTQSGATAALAKAQAVGGAVNNPVNPSDSFMHPVNQDSATAYPIVGYSWLLVYKNYTSTEGAGGVQSGTAPTKGQVEAMIFFFNWSLTKGAVYAPPGTTVKCFAPLPTTVRTAVINQLKTVKYNNVTAWR